MKCINRGWVVVVGILIALAGAAVPAHASFKPIAACGTTISASGDYQVTVDLTFTGTDCITITASQVSLKLNGHAIIGGLGFVGINIDLPSGRVNHVGIQGPGVIKNWTHGIRFNNTDYSNVQGVTAAQNSLNGILGFGNTFLLVSSNVLVGNGVWGLLLSSPTNSTIQYNEVSGNGGGGFAAAGGMIIGGATNTVNNNTAIGNGAQVGTPNFNAGIVISATGTRVYSNVTDGNVGPGIEVTGTGNQIFSNQSSAGNGTFDLQDDNTTCASNLWSNNAFFTRSQTCIQ